MTIRSQLKTIKENWLIAGLVVLLVLIALLSDGGGAADAALQVDFIRIRRRHGIRKGGCGSNDGGICTHHR